MKVLKYTAAIALTALVVHLMIAGTSILLPLVIAVFVWYLINALATVIRGVHFRGKPLPRSLRLGASIMVLLVASWLVLNLVLGSINQVSAAAPVYEENLRTLTDRVGQWIGVEYASRLKALVEGFTLSAMIRRFALAAASIIGSAGTIAIYVVFLLLEQKSFDQKIRALFPDTARQALVRKILQRIGSETQTYVWLKTLTSLITGVCSYLVMRFVGVDFAAFWALLIFALNYIPYIGAMLGVVFPATIALVQFDTLKPFVVTVCVLAVVQFTTGSILEPRIMGKGLNLSPVIMLLSLAFWAAIWGVVGMFLAVPLMVVIMIVCSHFQATRPIAIIMSARGELPTDDARLGDEGIAKRVA